ncbi:Multi antimicrobial extrusion protein (Na(+)/drug antiporter), MATE family of MDR efflux pump [Lunatimonas lonarensis]|uniref:Multidrug-efflux transporter n=1 Tax=Lunatimonas lonarensis TaxID=1232681 RepID=R7ZS37_9BACT|nr:MATE family efflux transporter [Lunatimonas lonarensis]EON76925.1 Multi antimicrobial extrusion protein (Na(+)/drug antiporter), MATE family of MDR efflux pump [Lunatimonas lonarensis]
MVGANYTKHVGVTFRLAYPVMLSQLGQVLVGVADNIMVGRLGAETLAAASLANSIFFLILMFGTGVSMAITPLVAMADGEGNKRSISTVFQHGFAINTVSGALLFLLILSLSPGLHFLGQPDEVVVLAIPYLLIITFSLVPLMFFQTFKQFIEGLSQTKQAMNITLACNAINIFLNWLLIYGKLGFPAMGLNGAGWATLISRVLMALIILYYVRRSKRYRSYHLPFSFSKLRKKIVGRLLKIGIPTGFQFVFEVGAFSTAAIMMGWLGVNALAAHQIAINLASVSYMMASGLAAAAMVRVGNQLGRRDIHTLREVGFSIFGMVALFMSVFAIVFIGLRNYLPLIYIDDPGVVQTAAVLLVIAGIFQVSDGMQVVGLGALRGLSDLKVPTLVTLVAYWVVGLPLGYLLAFPFGLDELGIWIGLLTGLTATAVLLFWRFHRISKRMLSTHHEPVDNTSIKPAGAG